MRSKKGLSAGVMTLLILALAIAPAAMADQEQALTYFKGGKYLEAAGEFQALIDEHPDYAYAYFMLGNCFLKTNKAADAEKNLLKAIELKGDDFLYHYQLANAYVMLGKNSKVVSTLNNAEALAPNAQLKQVLHKMRGFAYYGDEDWQAAVADLKLAGSDAEVVNRLAKAQFALGDTQAAATAFADAVKASPDDAGLRRLYGETLLNQARESKSDSQKAKAYSEALAQAEMFRKLKPSSFDADNMVGRAALGAKQYDKAVAAFTAALKKQPDQCNAMINQGKALMSKKDWANSFRSFDNATKCDAKKSEAWVNKAYTLQKQEKLEQAVENYGKALSLNPDSSFAAKNIEICRTNIVIRDDNSAMAKKEAKQKAEDDQAQRDFDEAQRKNEEWKTKTEEDD
jgi:tetratricopeptide (TPR) repeat protein